MKIKTLSAFNYLLKVILLTIISLAFVISTPIKSYAVDDNIDISSLAKKGIFYSNTVFTTFPTPPNKAGNLKLDWVGANNKIEALGFDTIYGDSARYSTYSGEVPGKAETLSEYIKADKTVIDGYVRNYSLYEPSDDDNGGKIVSNNGSEEKDNPFPKWTSSSTDDQVHAFPLSSLQTDLRKASDSGAAFVTILGMVAGAICSLFIFIIDILVKIGSFDPTFLVDILDLNNPKNGLISTISSLFLGSNGSISPLFVISIAMFMIGIVALLINYIKTGAAASAELWGEVGVLVIAMIVAGTCYTGNLGNVSGAITKGTNSVVTSLLSPNTNSENNLNSLYAYSVENRASESNSSDLVALTKKIYIDSVITSQFNVPVNELFISTNGNDKSNKTLGNTSIVDSIVASSGNAVGDLFSIKTNNNAGTPIKNLGYYWYAACTDIKTGGIPFEQMSTSDGSVKIIAAGENSELGPLFVIDYLSVLEKQLKNGSGYTEAEKQEQLSKINKIIESFAWGASGKSTNPLIILVYIAMVFAIIFTVPFILMNTLLFTVGIIFTPIVPIMLLVKQGGIREKVKPMISTWGCAALKMVCGKVMLLLIISFTSTICESGTNFSYILAIVFLFVMAYFSPKIFILLNDTLGKYEVGQVRTLNNNFNNKVPGFMKQSRSVLENRKASMDKMREMNAEAESLHNEKLEDVNLNDDIANSMFTNIDSLRENGGSIKNGDSEGNVSQEEKHKDFLSEKQHKEIGDDINNMIEDFNKLDEFDVKTLEDNGIKLSSRSKDYLKALNVLDSAEFKRYDTNKKLVVNNAKRIIESNIIMRYAPADVRNFVSDTAGKAAEMNYKLKHKNVGVKVGKKVITYTSALNTKKNFEQSGILEDGVRRGKNRNEVRDYIKQVENIKETRQKQINDKIGNILKENKKNFNSKSKNWNTGKNEKE